MIVFRSLTVSSASARTSQRPAGPYYKKNNGDILLLLLFPVIIIRPVGVAGFPAAGQKDKCRVRAHYVLFKLA